MTRQQILRYAKRVLLSLTCSNLHYLSTCKGKHLFYSGKVNGNNFMRFTTSHHIFALHLIVLFMQKQQTSVGFEIELVFRSK